MRLTPIIILFLIANSLFGQTEFTFVFLNKKTIAEELPKEQLDELMKGHLANIDRLAKENKLVAAGPFDGGGGIFIFKSNSVQQVEEWLATDPGIKAKRWDIEILAYQPLIGSVCKVGEKYEMVSYNFIRFIPEIKKSTVHDAPKLIADHEAYWKKNKSSEVITFGTFGGEDGDILISSKSINETLLFGDPSVSHDAMQFERKVLWIAKGSFCEQ